LANGGTSGVEALAYAVRELKTFIIRDKVYPVTGHEVPVE